MLKSSTQTLIADPAAEHYGLRKQRFIVELDGQHHIRTHVITDAQPSTVGNTGPDEPTKININAIRRPERVPASALWTHLDFRS